MLQAAQERANVLLCIGPEDMVQTLPTELCLDNKYYSATLCMVRSVDQNAADGVVLLCSGQSEPDWSVYSAYDGDSAVLVLVDASGKWRQQTHERDVLWIDASSSDESVWLDDLKEALECHRWRVMDMKPLVRGRPLGWTADRLPERGPDENLAQEDAFSDHGDLNTLSPPGDGQEDMFDMEAILDMQKRLFLTSEPTLGDGETADLDKTFRALREIKEMAASMPDKRLELAERVALAFGLSDVFDE
ncbi:hypothetical protein HDV03_000932 [Kappamyces sp. JEL0829]|nr:hypothetical protein HDV03_000932 [Kappamyces sp. JEL0829]